MSVATFEYSDALYKAFDELAEQTQVDGISVRVFRGSITERWSSIGASQSFYTPVMHTLKELGCITLISSGRRSHPSIVALHHPPDEVEFLLTHTGDLTGSPEAAKLRKRLENLERRVGGVNIAEVLLELEKRVAWLERHVGKEQ